MPEANSNLQDGAPPVAAHAGDSLPPGARVGEFEIRRVLGAGGFGVVYLAWDHALEREVALKEYLPVTLAVRAPNGRIVVRAENHAETFALGLRSFVNEARMLARFDHPSLVKVYRFWEDNGTAYMAMPMYHGRTLRQVRQAMAAGSPGEAWCRAMIDPMLDALERMHREDIFHRDIAPDNILLTDEGHAVLLDFGAARRVIGDRTHALTAILKPHFAPIEQYADVSSMRQGPWTDLYGLGATVYYLLTGQPPLPAAARALHDELQPLTRVKPTGCSEAFLAAVDWAMAVRPQERPQSVAIWRDVLEGRMDVPSVLHRDKTQPNVATRDVLAASPPPAATDFDPTQPEPSPTAVPGHVTAGQVSAARAVWRGFTVPAAEALDQVPTRPMQWEGDEEEPAEETASSALPEPARPARHRARRLPPIAWVLGGGAGALALIAVAAGLWSSRAGQEAAGAAPAAASAPVAVASAPTPASATPVQAAVAPPPAPVVAASSPPAATAVQRPPASPAVIGNAAALDPDEEIVPRPSAPRRSARAASRKPSQQVAEASERRAATSDDVEHRCAGRNFLSRLICEKRACDNEPRLHSDPVCVKMRREEEERRERVFNH
jgi:serine/threonine protein kinase